MGIIFQPYYDNAPDIIIGGVKDSTDFAGGKTGVTGPFPRYSISREDLSSGDGTYLRSKYSITVTGTATIKSNTEQDATIKGQRQNAIQGEAIIVSNLNLQEAAQHGNGKLTITPYGGHANKIIFSDARLLSVEMPEQTEESLGVQNLEYTLSFEAYLNKSNANSQTGSADADTNVLNVSSAEESWELTANEGTFSFKENAFTATALAPTIPPSPSVIYSPYKTFTLTHTLKAVGIKTFNDVIPAVGDSPAVPTTVTTAWKSARDWVKSRICKNVETNITTGVNNAGNAERADTIFNPLKMGDDTDFIDLSEFKSYNLVRTFSSDIAGGSYGVTETWLISEESQAVTHEVEASVENSQEAPAASVTVNGTIQGLETVSTADLAIPTTEGKYANAQAALATVLNNAYGLANSVYISSGVGGSLRTVEINKTIGHNPVTGTITWSVTFDDLVVSFPNAVREDINVTYENEFGTNKVVAILAILDKANGPIIQDIGTTQEKKVSVSIDLVMEKAFRTTKPSKGDNASTLEDLANSYKPTATTGGVYQESRSETWNPKSGAFNLSIGWVHI
jgi:hypothetical protein